MAVEISSIPRSTAPVGARHEAAPVPLHLAAELLRGLNNEQRTAVKHGDGPLLVIAGPGTGKTEVITRRLAWLIATKRARPREILALTFTDNAAEEMQSRVDFLVPYGQADTRIQTFHAFGDSLLREHAFELGLPGDLRLINRSEAVVLLRENMFTLGVESYLPLGDPTRFLGALVDLFQRARDEDVSPAAVRDWIERNSGPEGLESELWSRRLELARAFERYLELLHCRGLIDHGDQLALPLRLLREHESLRRKLHGRHRYLLVDEFQDMNPAQVALVELLMGRARNVTVVGDPEQAIYTFRGAGWDNVSEFEARNGGPKRIVLKRNYRSRQPIIDAARRLMENGESRPADRPGQVAHRRGAAASAVRVLTFETASQEADGVAQAIVDAIARGARPRDFAVLARSNHEIEPLARAMRVRDLPVRTHLPSDFFAHPQVRPLLAFLRVIADPEQTIEVYALATSFPYRLNAQQLTGVLASARRAHRSLWEQFVLLADDRADSSPFARGVRRFVADVRAGIEMSHDHASTDVLYDYLRHSGRLARLATSDDPADARAVGRFFEIVRGRARLLAHDRVGLLVSHLDVLIDAEDASADTGPLDLDAVSVLTVHRAKGLEFNRVYLTGLTDGRFPTRGRRAALGLPWHEIKGEEASDPESLEDERRLCFVAMTRARDELWLTHHVAVSEVGGKRRPSPFLAAVVDVPSLALPVPVDPMSLVRPEPSPSVEAQPSRGRSATFSFSELETYLECPKRYQYRHVVGLPTASHHALVYGSAMHQAVAAFHIARQRGVALSEDELLGVFAAAWSPQGFLSREHEEARYAAGREALKRFRGAQLREESNVVAIERPFELRLDEMTIRGRMDRVDATPAGAVVIDYKSSDVTDQAKANEKARNSLQLQVYAMAAEAQFGSLPSKVQLHFLDAGIVGSATPDSTLLAKARTKLHSAAEGIRAADFKPRPSAIACGYCPYRQVCSDSAA